jgi:Spy/CpxP family protein refolding chaperone
MKKQVIAALSVALFAASSGTAVAGPGSDGEGHEHKQRFRHAAGMQDAGDPERMVSHLTQKLELDQTQQQEIGNIVSAAKPELDALRDRAEANRSAMHELDFNEGDYDVRLQALATEKGEIATEQALLHGRLKSEINAVLTPAQRQQLAAASDRMRDRFQKHRKSGARG